MVGHFCYESGEHLATYTCEKIELQAMRNRYGVDFPISVPPTQADLESPEYVLSYLSSIHALQAALPEDHDEWHTEHFTPAFSGLYSAAQIGLDDPFMDGRDCIMRMTTRLACISLFSDGVLWKNRQICKLWRLI